MSSIIRCSDKDIGMLAREWDALAPVRFQQIQSGKDLSYDLILQPTMLKLLEGEDLSRVLDIGSGVGVFSSHLAQIAEEVVGVEPSGVSVEIARHSASGLTNLSYRQETAEQAAAHLPPDCFTAATACMMLMTAPDLDGIARSLARLLQNNGAFVTVFCHPWYWSFYWGYAKEPWYSYQDEAFVEAPFSISQERTEHITTHIHRPLERYLTAFLQAGFRLEAFLEPMPPHDQEQLFPARWEYPRFVAMRWRLER